jgi:hypothetical protein
MIKILTEHRNYNQVLKPSNVQKQTTLGIYNSIAIPNVLCGCKSWTLKVQDKSRMTAA